MTAGGLVAGGLTVASTGLSGTAAAAAAETRSDCWQTTDQFVTALGEAATGTPLSSKRHKELVTTLDKAAFGDERANLVKNVPGSPDLFGGNYNARGRSGAQLVRDVVEGVAHRAPTEADYTAALPKIAAAKSSLDRYFAVWDVIKDEVTPNAKRLCTTAEADPVPATYVIGSDVTADGKYSSAYDTADVQFRTEVVVFKKADATMTDASFGGDSPNLTTAFTLTASTDTGRTGLANVKVGARLAVETTDGQSSVLVKVEAVTGTGDSRTVSGPVIELPDLIRSGSMNLTDQINGAIGPALRAAATSPDRAQSAEEVGTFYDVDGKPISTADATPGSDAAELTPAVWVTHNDTDGICQNWKNLSLKVAVGSAEKGIIAAPDNEVLDLVTTGNISDGDRKVSAAVAAKLEGRGCLNLQAKDWTVSAGKTTGQIQYSNSVRFKIATKLSGEVAWEWKLWEKKFYVPVPIPPLGIVIPSTLAKGVALPLKAELAGGDGLTWNYGRQYTGESATTTFDTTADPMVSQTATPGTWSDYGDQGAGSGGLIDGKVSIAIKPYSKFTFADIAGSIKVGSGPVTFPDWIMNNPWAQGLISLALEATTPELSGSLATDETCTGTTNTSTTRLKLTSAVKVSAKIAVAEAILAKWNINAPSAQFGVDLLTASLPTLDVWTGPGTGDCGGGDGGDDFGPNGKCQPKIDGELGGDHKITNEGTLADCVYPAGYWVRDTKGYQACNNDVTSCGYAKPDTYWQKTTCSGWYDSTQGGKGFKVTSSTSDYSTPYYSGVRTWTYFRYATPNSTILEWVTRSTAPWGVNKGQVTSLKFVKEKPASNGSCTYEYP